VLSVKRQLTWPALLNARDLGGLPTGNGATRFGAVVRSDSLHRLTDVGWADLEAYGVATIVDIRAPSECRVRPIRVRGAVNYRNVPLLDDVALARVARRFDVEGENYLWQLEHHARRVGTILTVIADAASGGVLVHCAAGKDRTGLIASLVLAIAGVDREVIASDYALSAAAVVAMMEEHQAAEPDPSRWDLVRHMYQSPPDAISSLLAELAR
jgi:protein-tyrosine phosphatase